MYTAPKMALVLFIALALQAVIEYFLAVEDPCRLECCLQELLPRAQHASTPPRPLSVGLKPGSTTKVPLPATDIPMAL